MAIASPAVSGEHPPVLDGFDLTDHARFATGFPHDVFARLRREAPVLWHPPGQTADQEGFWVFSRYSDIRTAAADPTFSSQGGGGRAGGGTHIDDLQTGVHAGVLLNMLDDPRHELIKHLAQPPVTRPTVEQRIPEIRELARDLVTRALASGTCDFQPDVSAPYAISTIALILGAPREDWPDLLTWAQAVAGFDDRESGKVNDQAAATAYAIYEYSQKLVAAKQAAEPAADLMSVMSRQDIPSGHGESPLSEYERHAFFCFLLLAGSEAPRNAMAAGMLALARHPEQWQALCQDRSLIPTAIEEMLRWSSPTPYNRRTTTRDVDFAGAQIKAGQKVTLWWASANRDESVFSNPGIFDIRRSPNPHLAFGDGTHFCLGDQLGRLEIRLLLEEMLDRVAEIRVDGDVTWAPSNKHTVTLHMPVQLVPAG